MPPERSLEVIGARPFYWEADAFRPFYLGQSARLSRGHSPEKGQRGPHTPIDRAKLRQLREHASLEPDAAPLSRLLWLKFPFYLRIGEASSVRNADIQFDASGRPGGVLLRASSVAAALAASFDQRPKGSQAPGGKQWAPPADALAIEALRHVSLLPETVPTERRFNAFIQGVADRERWGAGWWSSHGLRHGRVQDRLRAHASPDAIQSEGRWRSRAAFEVYLS